MSPEELAGRMADTLRSTTRENRTARASALLPFATALLAAERGLNHLVEEPVDELGKCEAILQHWSHTTPHCPRCVVDAALASVREALR